MAHGEPLRLHIGGMEPREGWKILNVQDGPGVDFVGTCVDLSRFADASVLEIYASHVYEHLGYLDELPRALAEAHRVLKPGGLIRIGVPDLETLARLLLDPKTPIDRKWLVQRIIMGGQTDPTDFHRVAFTFEFLKEFLVRAGFNEPTIRRVKTFDLFDDASNASVLGVNISLNVQALK